MKQIILSLLVWGVMADSKILDKPYWVRWLQADEVSAYLDCQDETKWQCEDMAESLNEAHLRRQEPVYSTDGCSESDQDGNCLDQFNGKKP